MVAILCLSLMLAGGQTFGAQMRQPAAAQQPQPKGTAVIRGRVMAADTGRPLRRAQVRVSSPELPQGRTVSTNPQGAYIVRDLPAGRYEIFVSRGGFLSIGYGQKDAGEPQKPLLVADGQTLDRVDFALIRAGVISGRITDEAGEPFADIDVWPMQTQFFRGRRKLIPITSSARTDDSGQYRLLGVPPGDYVLMATTRETWKTGGEKPEVFGYAPSFYPGAAAATDARRVRIGIGEQISSIDFSMQPQRASTMSGTATSSDGTPLAGTTMELTQVFAGPMFSRSAMIATTKIAGDGSWVFRDMAPGQYQLEVSTSDRNRPSEHAFLPIVLAGVDLEGLLLVTSAGGTLAGQVVTDDGTPLPGTARLRVTAQAVVPDMRVMGAGSGEDNGAVGVDGSFVLRGVFGPSVVRVGGLPPGWAIKSIEAAGGDYADTPLEIAGSRRVDGARIVITNKFPQLTGRIVDERGAPAEGMVILFVTDSSKWSEAAGTARTARPDQSGLFRFDAVRPGEYFAIALDAVQRWQVYDPEFLEGLRDRATRLNLTERETEVLTLRVQAAR